MFIHKILLVKKPLEIRMGKGKGSVDHWVFNVRPGMILFEIESEFKPVVLKALKLVQMRISINTKIIFKILCSCIIILYL